MATENLYLILSNALLNTGGKQVHRLLGYEVSTDILDDLETKARFAAQEVGASTQTSVLPVGTVSSIEKRTVSIPGWRYAIGVRGLDLYNRTFAESSFFVTKPLRTIDPITKISLETVESIPVEFMSYGLSERNSWIQYQISVNGADWYPISPIHHNVLGGGSIPPKVYEIGRAIARDQDVQVLRGLIPSEDPVYEVRLKVMFRRPPALPDMSPILEEYCLHCSHEGGIL